MFSNQMYAWISSEILENSDCSLAAFYIDYDGKPCKILQLDQWRNSTLKLMTPNQILKNAFCSHLLPALT